jgi:hypothetical protein
VAAARLHFSVSPVPHVALTLGAVPTTAMTHIAIAEALDGKVVDWMEHVSDAQYHT